MFFTVFVGLWILWFASPWSRPATISRDRRARGWSPRFRFSRCCSAIARFMRRSGSPAISERFAISAPTRRALLYATDHLALWGWLDVFRRAEGELFPGLTITLLVLAGAIFVRDRIHAHVSSWMLARRILIVLTVVDGARVAQRRRHGAVAARAIRHPAAVGVESRSSRSRSRWCSHSASR